MQSKSEAEAAGLQSELELATEEMERSQQRLATLEQEKQGLLTCLQQQQAGGGMAGGQEGGEEGVGTAGLAGSGGSKVAEESLRQELYAQVGARFCSVAFYLAPGWAATRTSPAWSVD